MEVIVLDLNFKFLEAFKAVYRNGVLVHKRGERKFMLPFIKFVLFKSGGYIEEMEFDYHKTIDVGQQRLALYQWDGKNLHQLTFHDVPESSTLVDFKNEWEKSKLVEDMAMPPLPGSQLEQIAKILWAVAVLVGTLAIVYSTINLTTTYTKLSQNTPAYNISQQNAKILLFNQKELNITEAQVQSMERYINATVLYMQQHP